MLLITRILPRKWLPLIAFLACALGHQPAHPRTRGSSMTGVLDIGLPVDTNNYTTTKLTPEQIDKELATLNLQVKNTSQQITGTIQQTYVATLENLMNNSANGSLSTAQSDKLKDLLIASSSSNLLLKNQQVFVRENVDNIYPKRKVKPFNKITLIKELRDLRDITLENIEFCLQEHCMITGKSVLLKCPVRITFCKDISTNTVILKGVPILPQKLSSFIPELAKTPLNSLEFPTPVIIVSTQGFIDKKTQVMYPEGISFFSYLKTSNSLFGPIKKIIPGLPDVMYCGASISVIPNIPPITIISVMGSIGTKAKIGSTTLSNITLSISAMPPKPEITISIKGVINATLPKQKSPTLFIGGFSFDADSTKSGITLEATMEGAWENVFGFKNLAIENVGLECGIDFITEPPYMIPSDFGYTGTLQIGSKKFMMASKISDDGEEVLQGKLDGSLSFEDIVKTLNSMGLTIPVNTIPKELAEIKDVDLKMATKSTAIGDIFFLQGITFKGSTTLLGETVTLNINADPLSGIFAAGSLSKVSIANFFKLTGKGLDGKANTADDGPAFKIALTPKEQCIYLSGQAILFGLDSATEVQIDNKGISLQSNLDLFGLAKMSLLGKTKKTKGVDNLFVQGTLDAIKIHLTKEDLHNALKQLEQDKTAAITKFKRSLAAISKKINSTKKQFTLKKNPASLIRLELKKAEIAAELATKETSLEVQMSAVKSTLATHPAVNKLSTIFIKKLTISGSLLNPIPHIYCEIVAFNTTKTLKFDCDSLQNLGQTIVKKCLPLIKDAKL